MTFICDKCGEETNTFGLRFNMSTDYKPSQPDNPAQADHFRGHLCITCRADFRDFLEWGET